MSMTSDPFTTAAMVTGASQGIGREIALALAQAGHDLLITDLGLESLHWSTTPVFLRCRDPHWKQACKIGMR